MVAGFVESGKWKSYLITTWILLCGIASVQYIVSAPQIDRPAYRAAGWILANKYGTNLDKLFAIRSVAETQFHDELLIGFGWGLSASILANRKDTVAIEKLIRVIKQCPIAYRGGMIKGIHYSFNKGLTPVLDPELETIIDSRLRME